MNYGKAVRIARSIAYISQSKLAESADLDRSYLSLIESEKRQPTLETLESISSALGMPFHLLTLLATEKKDSDRIAVEQVNELAKSLTELLLEHSKNGDESRTAAATSKNSKRVGVSARGKQAGAALARTRP